MIKKTFLLDDLPKIKPPFCGTDHNLNLIYSFLYPRVFIRKNNKFISTIITDCSKGMDMRLKSRKNIFNITVKNIFNTLKFILKTRQPSASYLSFIVGVKAFLKNTGSFDDIELHLKGNTLIAKMYDSFSYKECFAAIEFAPVQIKNSFKGFSQWYIREQTKNSIILKSSKTEDEVLFLKMKNFSEQLDFLTNNLNIAYTGFTSTPDDFIKNEKNYSIPSNLEYRLIVSKNIVKNGLKDFSNELRIYIIYQIFFKLLIYQLTIQLLGHYQNQKLKS